MMMPLPFTQCIGMGAFSRKFFRSSVSVFKAICSNSLVVIVSLIFLLVAAFNFLIQSFLSILKCFRCYTWIFVKHFCFGFFQSGNDHGMCGAYMFDGSDNILCEARFRIC